MGVSTTVLPGPKDGLPTGEAEQDQGVARNLGGPRQSTKRSSKYAGTRQLFLALAPGQFVAARWAVPLTYRREQTPAP